MSFSLNKLRSFLPGQNNNSSDINKRHSVSYSLEPEIGFQLILEPNATGNENRNNKDVPELNVQLISARHLPTLFGFKVVQGYMVKVKLFPGSKRFDSSIQTNSWPKFNENFRFPLGSDIKSSLKSYSKDKISSDNLPEKVFSGHFVVFTVYALLELPPGSFNRFNKTYRSLRDKGTSLIQKVSDSNSKTKDEATKSKVEKKGSENIPQLTRSEAKRNIGSVTCYLEPKIFKKNSRDDQFITDEIWLPIKDIMTTTSRGQSNVNNVSSSTKGQIELILEISDGENDEIVQKERNDEDLSKENGSGIKRQWSLTEVKRKIKGGKSSKSDNKLCFKITTSKMRCSIKVKDSLENTAGLIYVKTSVFEHNILSNSWKCDTFVPSLSTRWDPELSTVVIPLKSDQNWNDISIRTTVATKTKVGKKIILGTVLINSASTGTALEHWRNVMSSRNQPIAMWHNFQ